MPIGVTPSERAPHALGFEALARFIENEAAFQVMLLPAHEPWMTGSLGYHHLFWDHDAVGLRDHPVGDG